MSEKHDEAFDYYSSDSKNDSDAENEKKTENIENNVNSKTPNERQSSIKFTLDSDTGHQEHVHPEFSDSDDSSEKKTNYNFPNSPSNSNQSSQENFNAQPQQKSSIRSSPKAIITKRIMTPNGPKRASPVKKVENKSKEPSQTLLTVQQATQSPEPNTPLSSSRQDSSSAASSRSQTSHSSNRRKNAQSSTPQRRQTASGSRKRQDDEEEQDERVVAYKDLVNHGKQPPPHLVAPVQQMLYHAYVRAVQTENYDEGIKIDRAMRMNGCFLEERLETERRNEQRQAIMARLNQAESDYRDKENEWKNIMETFRKEQKQMRAELQQKHEQEEDEFAEVWGNPENFIEFNKPSPNLLALRKAQKEYAMGRDFESAKNIKMEADKLQKIETEEAERRALQAMMLAHQKLEFRQQREIKCFEERERRTELFITTERDQELVPLQMLIKQLNQSLNADEPQNLKPQKKEFKSTQRTRVNVAESLSLPPKDRSLVSQLNTYRVKDEPQKLELQGFDVKRMMKRPKSTIQFIKRK